MVKLPSKVPLIRVNHCIVSISTVSRSSFQLQFFSNFGGPLQHSEKALGTRCHVLSRSPGGQTTFCTRHHPHAIVTGRTLGPTSAFSPRLQAQDGVQL